MSVRTCILLGLTTAVLGLSLRLAVPVLPVDQAYRDVLAHYRALGAQGR